MIISHKYKFILFRPQKVAGTSIQLAMGIQCGESDIVPLLRPKDKYDKDCESFFERYKERNYSHEIKDAHLGPKSVLKNFGKYIFSKYYKITIIRNPWDAQVSNFWHWLVTYSKNGEFEKIMENNFDYTKKLFRERIVIDNKIWSNYWHYFDENGNCVCDCYLRFENIEKDYKELCDTIGIEYEKLPKAKSLKRINKNHYSDYYDDELIEKVRNKNKRMINQFGYEFEKNSGV